jgi:hypothetical protein
MALLFQLTQKLAHGFSAFWVRWPRKVGKLEAEQAWKKHVTPEDEEPIQNALDWQIPIFEAREPEYIPHPKTWIRNRRWEDEPPKKTTPNRTIGRTPEQAQQQDANQRITVLINHGMSRADAVRKVSLEQGWIKP